MGKLVADFIVETLLHAGVKHCYGVEIEQKAEGMLDTFTKLKNPTFAGVAGALGLWGRTISDADQLESAVKEWLAQPGPALLHGRGGDVWEMVKENFL
jgi:pyruvate dehydrogenase (quinone)